MTKKRSSEIFTLKIEIFPEIGPRKFCWVPQIRRQVSAHAHETSTGACRETRDLSTPMESENVSVELLVRNPDYWKERGRARVVVFYIISLYANVSEITLISI